MDLMLPNKLTNQLKTVSKMKMLGISPYKKRDDCHRLEELRSVRIFKEDCKEQLSHAPMLHGCYTWESEHSLEFSEDVIHKGTVNQTQTSLQNLTVQAKLIASRMKFARPEKVSESLCALASELWGLNPF